MFNQPIKSSIQKVLEIIDKRSSLTIEQQNVHRRLTAGYRGEVKFHSVLQNALVSNPIQLFNLHMKIDGSECQFDCLLIFQTEIFLLEIKNYQGDFFTENDSWYTSSKRKIKNPLLQLHRSEMLLQQFLDRNKSPFHIRSFVLFMNHGFTLYNASMSMPIIFPQQLNRFIQHMRNIPSAIQKHHHELVAALTSNHRTTSSFEEKPSYDYHSLEKGITCEKCRGFMVGLQTNNMQCDLCGYTEDFETAFMRNVEEFQTLFPNKRISIQTMKEWTNNCSSAYKIRKTLSSHCTFVENGRSSYYLLKENDSFKNSPSKPRDGGF